MSRKIGFWSVFALVTGSQIGSGIFMLPANLAPYGALSIVGWGVAGLGAIMLALVFAKLCAKFPRTGGPHAYVQAVFGKHAAFFTGWTYWVISWVSTAAVVSASVGYLSPLLGIESHFAHLILEIGLLITITVINAFGVQAAGFIEFFLSLLKIIPLVIIPAFALCFFNNNHFAPVDIASGLEAYQVIGHVTLIALWGFIGLECATTPAGSIENPTKTIPRAVVLGTLCVAMIYFINSISIMGVVPWHELQSSKAPYADAARLLLGGNWHIGVSLIAAIVCIGTLNAWTLTSGQVALGLAEDKLMPKLFAKKNRHGAPIFSILMSCIGIIPILFLTLNEGLASQINTIIDFSVTAFLFVYLACCFALLKWLFQDKAKHRWTDWAACLFSIAFCAWIIAATPWKTLAIASLFVFSGIPLYLWQRLSLRRTELILVKESLN